jgi:hypothetical protein
MTGSVDWLAGTAAQVDADPGDRNDAYDGDGKDHYHENNPAPVHPVSLPPASPTRRGPFTGRPQYRRIQAGSGEVGRVLRWRWSKGHVASPKPVLRLHHVLRPIGPPSLPVANHAEAVHHETHSDWD